ncbi:excinuclease ABC subunit UvrC [Clostridium formicaceticum]|uniref:UvrABC system protein C n=1 Tax=Clostridium formicaceticum TaxID=1497 RepID=A0AAC9WJ61_9CLOT|nr:excinuclease ABC subunit UvrC [Clostridium formicaceticum]AOY74800.1 excinuclease ABC subunit C [Clostridium formicaceticum]ARE89190.1 UvrABC system protein C [Clostridium formicaceticum]
MFDIKQQLKILPEKPGVYLMKNKEDEIIYVGKAISLKNRVRQYFQSLKNQPPKVKAMVANIYSFEYIITDTELEALILECNLIKENRPKYNILLRDDKTYPYIKITMKEAYPRVMKTRRFLKDGAKYFGPYTNVTALNETLEVIHQLFAIRKCKKNIAKSMEKGERPCLNFHIKNCLGPCTGRVEQEQYGQLIQEIILFLSGKENELIKKTQAKMQEAAAKMNYEGAAKYRDQVLALSSIVEKQKMVSTNEVDQDIIAVAKGDEESYVQVFFIRKGKVVQRQHYTLSTNEEEGIGEILSSFVKQFYNNMTFIPQEVLVEEELEDQQLMEDWLSTKRGSKVTMKSPKKGEKRKLVEMVKKNALLMMEQTKEIKARKKEEKERLLGELQEILELTVLPYRIEAFDISNIQGVESVGSMVVFEDGKPQNKEYRRFKIATVEGANDYASIEEIILRRFKRGLKETKNIIEGVTTIEEGKFSTFPDLIMVDGGLGQVHSVEKSLNALGLIIPVCGMIKDHRHRTRGLIYQGRELLIDKTSSLFRFIARVQEEAHRFAITYHKSLRKDTSMYSILQEIPGIGETRRKNLMKHFKDINKIKEATLEELTEVEGLNKTVAENIYTFFRKTN